MYFYNTFVWLLCNSFSDSTEQNVVLSFTSLTQNTHKIEIHQFVYTRNNTVTVSRTWMISPLYRHRNLLKWNYVNCTCLVGIKDISSPDDGTEGNCFNDTISGLWWRHDGNFFHWVKDNRSSLFLILYRRVQSHVPFRYHDFIYSFFISIEYYIIKQIKK